MLDVWEVFIAMATRIGIEDITLTQRTKHGLRTSLASLIAISAPAIEAKPEVAQYRPAPQFGWQASKAPATTSPVIKPVATWHSAAASAGESEARVITVMDAPGFNTLYLELESSARRFWIAAGATAVRAGNIVHFYGDQATAMDNFESKALKRTFERIYFVPAVTVAETGR